MTKYLQNYDIRSASAALCVYTKFAVPEYSLTGLLAWLNTTEKIVFMVEIIKRLFSLLKEVNTDSLAESAATTMETVRQLSVKLYMVYEISLKMTKLTNDILTCVRKKY